MVDRFNTRRWLFRRLLFGIAIGCWLSFVPSSKADGPVLVPPAPPAVDSPAISVPDLMPETEPEGPALPYPVDPPAIPVRTPALDESSIRTPLPILRTPDAAPARSLTFDQNVIVPDPNAQTDSDDAEFVIVPSRKRRTGFLGQSPRLQSAASPVTTQNAFPIRETPTFDAPNNAFPAGDESNIANQPFLTPVPTLDTPTDITPGEFNQLINRMVLSAVPSRHTDDGQWGGKKTITAGVDLGLKGLFLRAKRTTKEVDHGTWKRFEIKGKTGEKPYTVKVTKLRMINDGQFQFSAEYMVPLATVAELRDFSRGIRLRSITVDGEAVVQLAVDCTVLFESDSSTTVAERHVILYPLVNSAKLQLAEFNPVKSSRFKGLAGRELDRDTQRFVEQTLKKREPKLIESLNHQFAEHGFQLPLNELLDTKWGRMLAGSSDLAAAAK